jgi:hypothetical protein
MRDSGCSCKVPPRDRLATRKQPIPVAVCRSPPTGAATRPLHRHTPGRARSRRPHLGAPWLPRTISARLRRTHFGTTRLSGTSPARPSRIWRANSTRLSRASAARNWGAARLRTARSAWLRAAGSAAGVCAAGAGGLCAAGGVSAADGGSCDLPRSTVRECVAVPQLWQYSGGESYVPGAPWADHPHAVP